jgi:adenylate cyclase
MAASSSGHSYPVLAQALLGCTARESVQTPVPDITGRWRVPFRRVLDSYTVIPAADILAQHAPRELLAGRYVIVGASALGLSDRVATPLAASTAGFMVHAAALTALLDTPTAPWPGKLLAAAWTLLLVVLGYAALPRLSALSGMLLLAAGGLAWLPLAYAIAGSGAEFPLSAPLGAGFVLLAGAIPYEWWLAQRDSQRILEMFSHYVAPTVLAELLSHRLDDALAPTAKDVTVLIADMEGYTRHTSSLPLNEAARLTRDFLDALTRPVLDAGGTLDKYTGDGLVAFWGAPLPCPDQAEKALAAGNRILAEVAALNERRQAEGFPAVRVRIGIESGSALVGDLGTPFRSTYTAVGDCINFASKLQEAARDLPADLIVGPGAQARLGDKPELLTPLGTIPVRGSDHDMAVWGPR